MQIKLIGKFRFTGWMKANFKDGFKNHRIVAYKNGTGEILYCHKWLYRIVKRWAARKPQWDLFEKESLKKGINRISVKHFQDAEDGHAHIQVQERKEGLHLHRQRKRKNTKVAH